MKSLQPSLKNSDGTSDLQDCSVFWLMPYRCIASVPQGQYPGDRNLNGAGIGFLKNFLGTHSGAELIQNTETLQS